MTHESRESEVLAKRWHKFWKYASIASAISATAGLFFATGAIYWHSKAENEHQKEIDRIDEIPLASAGEPHVVNLSEVADEMGDDSNMFVDPSKIRVKH